MPLSRFARGCAPLAALPSSSQRRLVRIDVLTSGSDLHEGVVQEPHLPESLELSGFVARELRHCLVGHLVDVDCPEELHLRVLQESGGVEDVPELLLQPRGGAAAVEDVHELLLA